MTSAPLLTYYSAVLLCPIFRALHAVINRLFPNDFVVLDTANMSEFVE